MELLIDKRPLSARDDLQLLLGRPMPPANRVGDLFDTL
jgi:hypothetical protein